MLCSLAVLPQNKMLYRIDSVSFHLESQTTVSWTNSVIKETFRNALRSNLALTDTHIDEFLKIQFYHPDEQSSKCVSTGDC